MRGGVEMYKAHQDVLHLLAKRLRRGGCAIKKSNATLAARTGWSFKVEQTLKNHPVRAIEGSVAFS
jgi:hypothetical protein